MSIAAAALAQCWKILNDSPNPVRAWWHKLSPADRETALQSLGFHNDHAATPWDSLPANIQGRLAKMHDKARRIAYQFGGVNHA